jgi:hypothetical protein
VILSHTVHFVADFTCDTKKCTVKTKLKYIHSIYVLEQYITTTGEPVIRTVKYSHKVVLLAKEETLLQGMVDRLIVPGRCHGTEMNVENTKRMRISR